MERDVTQIIDDLVRTITSELTDLRRELQRLTQIERAALAVVEAHDDANDEMDWTHQMVDMFLRSSLDLPRPSTPCGTAPASPPNSGGSRREVLRHPAKVVSKESGTDSR